MPNKNSFQKQVTLLLDLYNISYHDVTIEPESYAYLAATFSHKNNIYIFRKAKKTPTKQGFFVTLWKRSTKGSIIPYDRTDNFDHVIIFVTEENKSGFFLFDKKILIKHNIISHTDVEGKRAIRIYPNWCLPTNKQALTTQKWQLPYFFDTTKNKNFLS
ncbi:MAG: hypothetical protein CL947_04020 [Epsilonproteobacteria bacterium]|nr:hypothetical protein [Campylobacterota bacterium]|tara:strand:- start:1520 stop:1996 length:477 start_codon:yes stop_codon:yes gene_type:complete